MNIFKILTRKLGLLSFHDREGVGFIAIVVQILAFGVWLSTPFHTEENMIYIFLISSFGSLLVLLMYSIDTIIECISMIVTRDRNTVEKFLTRKMVDDHHNHLLYCYYSDRPAPFIATSLVYSSVAAIVGAIIVFPLLFGSVVGVCAIIWGALWFARRKYDEYVEKEYR